MIYAILLSSFEIMSYERMSFTERLAYGEAVDQIFDFKDVARGLAFRATILGNETAEIDPNIAQWKARVAHSTN